jgi:thiamine-phosphate pyrophosphorylase
MKQYHFNPALYFILDSDFLFGHSWKYLLDAALQGGVTMIQVRSKQKSQHEFMSWAAEVKNYLRHDVIPLLVNDHPEIAMAVGADGVHLGLQDMRPTKAREILGPRAIIGWSLENLAQLDSGECQHTDYLAASPVFSTPTKMNTCPPWELEGLTKLRSLTAHPLVAIGGINHENAPKVIRTGADGIAVISAIASHTDPLVATKRLRLVIDNHRHPSRTLHD